MQSNGLILIMVTGAGIVLDQPCLAELPFRQLRAQVYASFACYGNGCLFLT
jgi:hypothetical protein